MSVKHVGLLCLLTLCAPATPAWAQAGRFFPRAPAAPSAGGSRFYFLPRGLGDSLGYDTWFWIIAGGAALVGVVVVGWKIGQALGGKPRESSSPDPLASPAALPSYEVYRGDVRDPVGDDLILTAEDVRPKAEQTEEVMRYLARTADPRIDPNDLRPWVENTFLQVQKSWEARDYSLTADLLAPALRREHEGQLAAMRRERLVNRLDGLRVSRLEFVHVSRGEEPDGGEFTALITFEAASYYEEDNNGDLKEGIKGRCLFQEFWVFRRLGASWRLETIERSHRSRRLALPNSPAGPGEEHARRATESLAT